MEAKYEMTLADGSKLIGLALNGNNYVSPTEVTEDVFTGKLETVTISDGETTDVLHNVELIQIAHYAPGWYISLREIPEAERMQMDMDALTVDHELRITLLELGLDEF